MQQHDDDDWEVMYAEDPVPLRLPDSPEPEHLKPEDPPIMEDYRDPDANEREVRLIQSISKG